MPRARPSERSTRSENFEGIYRDKPRAGDAPAARQGRQHHPEAPLSLFRIAGKVKTSLPKSDLSKPELRPHTTFRSLAEAINEDLRDGGEEQATPTNLGSILREISASSKIGLAGEKAGIMASFAARLASARGTVDPKDLPGIIRQIKAERRAALAIASRNATKDSHEKRQAVLQGKPAPRPRRTRAKGGPRNRHS